MDSQSRERLDEAVGIAAASRLRRALRQPARTTASLASSLAGRFSSLTFHVRARTFWGDRMEVVLPETVSLHIFRFGFFEEALTRVVLRCVERGGVFVDIGAHFGYFSLLAADLVGPRGAVYSFEPTPATFEVLRRNVGSLTNVHLAPMALHSKKGSMSISDFGLKNSAFNSMFAPRLSERSRSRMTETRHTVPVTTVDDFVAERGITPTFLKIDAESAEYAILEGAQRVLATHRPLVTLEVGDMNVPGAPTSRQLIDFMSEQGYDPLELQRGRFVRHRPKERYDYDNLLFAPRAGLAERLLGAS